MWCYFLVFKWIFQILNWLLAVIELWNNFRSTWMLDEKDKLGLTPAGKRHYPTISDCTDWIADSGKKSRGQTSWMPSKTTTWLPILARPSKDILICTNLKMISLKVKKTLFNNKSKTVVQKWSENRVKKLVLTKETFLYMESKKIIFMLLDLFVYFLLWWRMC